MSTQPHPDGVRLLPWRISPWIVDLALISLLVVAFLRQPFSEEAYFGAASWVELGIGVLALTTRRRFPLPTLAAMVVTTTTFVALADRPSVLIPVTLAILFTVGVRHERRLAILAGAITTVIFGGLVIALLRQGEIDGAGLASIAWPAFAVTAGIGVRSSRESMAAAQERALRAEQSRELEAERRVIEERLRIARDVHDLVAHHIAVINVQAGVASHLLESNPAAATDAVDTVREAASTVIDELGELLGVLRAGDTAEDPTSPTPNLASIDDLIASFAASGLVVQRTSTGTPRPLSGSVELTAYRVVQEALTNAHKHGDGSAAVSLCHDDTGLRLEVTNPISTTMGTEAGTGFGLIGMQERVEAVGGELIVSSTDSRFEIKARLPGRQASG